MTSRSPPTRSALGFVGAGVAAGAVYAAVDYVLDRMLGAGTLTGSLEYVHVIWFLTLPIATGAALGLTMYRRRDRADAALREATRADSLRSKLERVERDQAVWVMAAAVLHEVNNPLHALGLLLDEAADAESPEALLARARAHVDRIGKHVQTLRDLPRAGAPARELFDVRALVDRVLADRAHACAEANVSVSIRGEAQSLADASHARVIVENLVDNGIHVLRGATERRLELDVQQESGQATLRVHDSGPGVQEEPHALFEALRTTREGGLGLGLPVARALARAMDGEVELESSRVGATRVRAEAAGAMKAHVLLVEDEDDARESLRRTLERAGYTCTAAATKAEALSHAAFFDVVVSDVVLGHDEHAGLDLLPELRARGVDAPVVLITAFADMAKLKLALNRGAAYLLEKPFRAAELLEVLQSVLATTPDVSHRVERTLLGAGLTEKELVVARHLLKGLSSQEIAQLEQNSDKTIRQHVTRIYAKCGVSSRAEFFHFVLPL